MAIVRPKTSGFIVDPLLAQRRKDAAAREANLERSAQMLNLAFLQQNAVDAAKRRRDERAAEGAGILGDLRAMNKDTDKFNKDLRISTAMDMTPTPGEYDYDDQEMAQRTAAQMSGSGRGVSPTFMDDQLAAQQLLQALTAMGTPVAGPAVDFSGMAGGAPMAGAVAPVMRGQRGGTPDLQNQLLIQALASQLGGQPAMDPRLASLMALRAMQNRGQ